MSFSCTVSEIWWNIGQKLLISTYPTSVWCPWWGWPCWNIAEVFGVRKLVPGVVCVNRLRFALCYSAGLWWTDRQTDGQMGGHITTEYTVLAFCSKNLVKITIFRFLAPPLLVHDLSGCIPTAYTDQVEIWHGRVTPRGGEWIWHQVDSPSLDPF